MHFPCDYFLYYYYWGVNYGLVNLNWGQQLFQPKQQANKMNTMCFCDILHTKNVTITLDM